MNGPLVLDASVILKWVLPPEQEPYHVQAQAIAEAVAEKRVSVRVPALWYFEVGNILIRKYPSDAANDLADLRTHLALSESVMTKDWQGQILNLTSRYRVTFYDAAYHALAIIHGGIFITADEKYLAAVAGEPRAIHLRDWQ